MTRPHRHCRRGQRFLTFGLAVAMTGCGQVDEAPNTSQATTTVTNTADSADTTRDSGSPDTIQDVLGLPHFVPLEATTYYIDPDDDPSTPLRVFYTIPTDGWLQWIGTVKYEDPPDAEGHFVGVSIAAVTNVMVDACNDHRPTDPPIGPTVSDLAAALSELAPFIVTEPTTEVNTYGYSGRHLELTVPDDIPFEVHADGGHFTDCVSGELQSWLAPVLTYVFWGYAGPGQIEEFWILDVGGSRLMIQATWFPDSPPEDIAEMRAILDSIRIEP